jgi:hypothetical protein
MNSEEPFNNFLQQNELRSADLAVEDDLDKTQIITCIQ